MARAVSWSVTASSDLHEASDYIRRDSRFYAAGFVRQALAAGRSLSRFAERGRVVPEANDKSYRELFVGQYRLIYRFSQERVDVVAFVHGSRDLRTLWARYSGPGA